MSKKSGTFVSFAGVHPNEVASKKAGGSKVLEDIKDLSFEIWGENYADTAEYLALFENKSRDRGMIRADLLEIVRERRKSKEQPTSSDDTRVDL